MRNNKTQGFTLIELLIVIAIIGILAAVLIPNLLNARKLAQDRAAQAYGAQVYTALSAYIAADPDNDLTGKTLTCGAGADFTIGGGTQQFDVKDPGNAVDTCNVDIATNGDTEPIVNIVSINQTPYTFGD